jgi:hypothetical protein
MGDKLDLDRQEGLVCIIGILFEEPGDYLEVRGR